MKDSEAQAHAARAAEAWGGLAKPPSLIANRENAVFDVTLKDGRRAALRLHRSGYQTTPSIEAELIWTEALASAGFPCPVPLRTEAGELTHEPAFDPVTSLISWIDAEPIGAHGVPYSGDAAAHCALYRDVGALIRRLHDTTAALQLGPLPRPKWDIPGLLGEMPHWGRFWENPSLSGAERDELLSARERATAQLEDSKLDTGLIHADLLQENILSRAGDLWLIDFDDSGYGFLGYDLGTALIQHVEAPDYAGLSEALLDGYGADDAMAELLPLFVMLRGMASCGWIISRGAHDDPRQRVYADRALLCARRYVQTTTSSSS